LNLLPSIDELFNDACAKESGYLSLSVTSAFEMDDAQKRIQKKNYPNNLIQNVKLNFMWMKI